MLKTLKIEIDGVPFSGLVSADGISYDDAAPLLLEDRIAELEKTVRAMRENIRELLLARASERPGTAATIKHAEDAPIVETTPTAETPPETTPKKETRGCKPGHAGKRKQFATKPPSVKRIKTEKEDEQHPLVRAFCEQCRSDGDGWCIGCAVKKALDMAECQETPGEITQNAMSAVCVRCSKQSNTEHCQICRLGVFMAAKYKYNSGMSAENAAMNAHAEYMVEKAGDRR